MVGRGENLLDRTVTETADAASAGEATAAESPPPPRRSSARLLRGVRLTRAGRLPGVSGSMVMPWSSFASGCCAVRSAAPGSPWTRECARRSRSGRDHDPLVEDLTPSIARRSRRPRAASLRAQPGSGSPLDGRPSIVRPRARHPSAGGEQVLAEVCQATERIRQIREPALVRRLLALTRQLGVRVKRRDRVGRRQVDLRATVAGGDFPVRRPDRSPGACRWAPQQLHASPRLSPAWSERVTTLTVCRISS